MKKLSGTAGRIIISLFAIALVVFFLRGKLHEAWIILRHDVTWNYFFLGCLTYFAALLILSHRLHRIWVSQRVNLSYWDTLRVSYIGLFFNFFLPSAVGGDLAKIWFACKQGYDKVTVTTSIMMDRLLGFLVIILMGSTALIIERGTIRDPMVYFSMILFSIIILSFTLLFLSRRIGNRFRFLSGWIPSNRIAGILRKIYHAFHDYRNNLGLLLYGFVISVIIQSLIVFLTYLIAKSLQVDVPITIFFIIVPTTAIISMMPSIGGLGIREAGSIYLFSQYMPSERALAMTLLFDLVIYGFGLLGGLMFAFTGLHGKETLKNMEEFSDAGS